MCPRMCVPCAGGARLGDRWLHRSLLALRFVSALPSPLEASFHPSAPHTDTPCPANSDGTFSSQVRCPILGEAAQTPRSALVPSRSIHLLRSSCVPQADRAPARGEAPSRAWGVAGREWGTPHPPTHPPLHSGDRGCHHWTAGGPEPHPLASVQCAVCWPDAETPEHSPPRPPPAPLHPGMFHWTYL